MVLNKKFPKSSIHIATNNYFHKTQAQTAKQSSCLYTVQKKKTQQNNQYLKPPRSLYAL